ncbi:MAG TPA: ATP synthase F1 subunit epsilon [Candidatus Egerieimonas intestinavium]|uniref:ATP synthase epsilon chain n=1 Tax=Candidatus Egerieimonas intestinavium TaxID=2840777 RepID=A0A9D1JFS2_9FIRM|nr:ATP synthase F1 subunit epsilon [Candidatus Egerieimonas intestinavium]
MSSFGIEVYACDKVFYRGRGVSLTLPMPDGEGTLLPHHEDSIIALIPGVMKLRTEDGQEKIAVISAGMAQMINNRVKIFVHTAERPEEIDVNRARAARERAREQLRQKQSLAEYHINRVALARAMSRLSAASKYK